MIAIDTNVLLRYLLDDDLEQSAKAARLISGQQWVLVTDVVLVETIWTLKGKKYRLKKAELASVIQTLFEEANIRFEVGQAVWMALADYRAARAMRGKNADFADALIVNKAKFVASEQAEKLRAVYTFDMVAQRLPGMRPPA